MQRETKLGKFEVLEHKDVKGTLESDVKNREELKKYYSISKGKGSGKGIELENYG